MTIEFQDSDAPETATRTLVLGGRKNNYPVDTLSGRVGAGGDGADYWKIGYSTGVTDLELTGLGLWWVRQSGSGAAYERRGLKLTPLDNADGPVIELVAEYGSSGDGWTFAYAVNGINDALDLVRRELEDSDLPAWKRQQYEALAPAYEAALEALQAVRGGADPSGAQGLLALAEQVNSDLIKTAAQLLDRWLEPKFLIFEDDRLVSQESSPPIDFLPVYAVDKAKDLALFEVSGSVVITELDTSTGDTQGNAGGVTYQDIVEDMSYDLQFSWAGFTGPTEFNDELYGDDDEDDTIHLLAGDDTYYGLGGDDRIFGERGKDILEGGKGNDLLDGGSDKDRMRGGAGNDTYWVDNPGDLVDESVKGSSGRDLVNATVSFSLGGKQAPVGVENLTLIGLAKSGTGNSLDNVLTGNTRDNALRGGGGKDKLIGGAGSDILRGGGGVDKLIGGKGADRLTGGEGNDLFVFVAKSDSTTKSSGRDTVFDFQKGDRFDISELDANGRKDGNQGFSFIGADKFHGKAGELRYDKSKSGTYVYADANGDTKVDFAFQLDDTVKLAKVDFLL